MIFLNVITFIIISVISLYITNIISQKFNLFDYPDKKKIHLVKTPNIGGLAIIAPIILSFSIYNYSNEILMIFSCVMIATAVSERGITSSKFALESTTSREKINRSQMW